MSVLSIEAEKYIFDLFSEKLSSDFVYHNLAHTQRVVKKVEVFIEYLKLSEIDAENLLIAAWFHDSGFIKGAENHEQESVKILTHFLQEKNAEIKRIETISALILATKLTHQPVNDLEKIIRDADCAHLGDKSFDDKTALLRREWETQANKKFSDAKWIAININFLTKGHKYHSDYALKNWSKGKDKNLSKLLKNKNKLEDELKKNKKKKEALEIKKNKSNVPERGVETMFRVALKNHMTLSNIADTKANILLSVNAIIVSLALSNLLPKLDNPSNNYLIFPTVVFITFTVASIILSILATRPNVTQGKFTKEDVANKKVNLLFFGNFHQME
ncbi:Pycsar system effector family protein, partial [Polaribacter sp.]|uniref:Pycsar system effector family protein n=1 Tax=Polaribacter sp. TaxID=1920175 RepID=UPI003EEE378F